MDVDATRAEGSYAAAHNASTIANGAAGQHLQPPRQQTILQQTIPHQPAAIGNTAANYTNNVGKQPAAPIMTTIGGTSNGVTSPERRAQSVPIDPSRIKLRQHPNRFQPMTKHNSEETNADKDKVREGSVCDASGSRGSMRREPIPLSNHILLLLDILEPDKGRQGQLLKEHLTGHRAPPFTEEELAHVLA